MEDPKKNLKRGSPSEGEPKLFGTRFLNDEDDVFKHNAWDHVEWNEEQEKEAEVVVAKQKNTKLDETAADLLLLEPSRQWDDFYDNHLSKFFLDRNWLTHEFPMLIQETSHKNTIIEVGCGVGNTTFPLLKLIPGNTFIHSSDFSASAIDILKKDPQYDTSKCSAFVWDITRETNQIPDASGDIIVCIYVLSALKPDQQSTAISNLVRKLKPGGQLLLKDYGRYDLTQLRFKKNRYIDDNFYCRGDGTFVYFFTSDQLDTLFTNAGLVKVQNTVDRRLIVNRAKQVKMYRVWMQCVYKKPLL